MSIKLLTLIEYAFFSYESCDENKLVNPIQFIHPELNRKLDTLQDLCKHVNIVSVSEMHALILYIDINIINE